MWVLEVMFDVRMVNHEVSGGFVDEIAAFCDGEGDYAGLRGGKLLYGTLEVFRGLDVIDHGADDAGRLRGGRPFHNREEVVLTPQSVAHAIIATENANAALSPAFGVRQFQ